jgi:hypothetical protein
VKGGLLLDVVVRKGPAVLQLLAGKDETLLIWGDALLVLENKNSKSFMKICFEIERAWFNAIILQISTVAQFNFEKSIF